jgi:hypothetical protein
MSGRKIALGGIRNRYMNDVLPPFSARNRTDTLPVDGAFPASARIGLIHLLTGAIGKGYIHDWGVVVSELQRIARVPPSSGGELTATRIVNGLRWDRVFDFCERMYGHLAQGTEFMVSGTLIRKSRSDAQAFLAAELERLFQEENFAYEFREGAVQRRGRRHTIDRVAKAEAALAEAGLDSARQHFAKAQRYFRDRVNPDTENAVKKRYARSRMRPRNCFQMPMQLLWAM